MESPRLAVLATAALVALVAATAAAAAAAARPPTPLPLLTPPPPLLPLPPPPSSPSPRASSVRRAAELVAVRAGAEVEEVDASHGISVNLFELIAWTYIKIKRDSFEIELHVYAARPPLV
jgi:hypothetical protein